MKTNPFVKILSIGLVIGLILPAVAENEEDEVEYPTSKETLRFLKKQMPLAIEMLDTVKKEEGEQEYEEVLEGFQEQYFEYLEIRQHDGQEAAYLMLAGVRIELRMDQALHTYHNDEVDKEKRAGLVREIEKLVREKLIHNQKSMTMEVKLMEANLKELKAELAELKEIGEEAVKQEVRELLHEEDEDEEESEERDEEDDE